MCGFLNPALWSSLEPRETLHQYTVDVLGNAPGLNYASDYRSVSGVMVPTKRRVFAHDGEKRKISGPLLVAIDICEIEFG